MGFRTSEDGATLAASVEDGVLSVYAGNRVLHANIPTGKLKFKKQCNFFLIKDVRAYLANDEYILILRYDGTGTVLTKKDKYLVKNFKFDQLMLPLFECPVLLGYCEATDVGNKSGIYRTAYSGCGSDYILFADNIPLVLCIDGKKNQELVQQMRDVRDGNRIIFEYNKELHALLYLNKAKPASYIIECETTEYANSFALYVGGTGVCE